jgi:hypothetical protein
MSGMSFVEFLVVLITAIIKVGIPAVVAIWIIRALRRIRADNEAIKSKLEAIEQRLQSDIRN